MSKFSLLSITICLFVIGSLSAQKKDKVLFTVGETPVYTKEFKNGYNRNLDLVDKQGQNTIEAYLEMFVNYKLKVKEAYAQNFHQSLAYKKDFSKYQEQLARNYIYEDKLTSELAKEAYDRGLYELEASHILIKVDYSAVPQDTLIAYRKIQEIQNKALRGEDFTKLAKAYSQEPMVEKTGGYLGYFTAFSFVYSFETMAYRTKVGHVSEIVRTQYGYHIIKVHSKRKKEGDVTVSHIMVSFKGDTTAHSESKKRIDDIYALLEQGSRFESLAKQYSEDKNSSQNGGKLPRFSKGKLRSSAFEEQAYRLVNPGDISKPVKTKFGWHIIQLEERHPRPTFQERKEKLEKEVALGNRSKVITAEVKSRIKELYGYQDVENYKLFFNTFVTDSLLKRNWDYTPLLEKQNKILFIIGAKEVRYNDFAAFIKERQLKRVSVRTKEGMLTAFYDEFETKLIKDYFKNRLEEENQEYATIINEYRDGLLIFEVMKQNVWEKSREDTIGQRNFFNLNNDLYQWKRRFDVEIISSQKKEVVVKAEKLFASGLDGVQIKEMLNERKVNALLTKGIYEAGDYRLPSSFAPKVGSTIILPESDAFKVIYVKDIMEPTSKKFENVKGRVLNDYQKFIEKEWLNELRIKHPVKINKRIFKKLKKQLK